MTLFNYIIWDVSPEIFTLFDRITVRWYGLLFALGFLIGQRILVYIFQKDGKLESHVEELTVYMVVSTIIGARLGHCLFYQPEHYLTHPIDILKIWEGGLASHGATVGILSALWLYVNYSITFSKADVERKGKAGEENKAKKKVRYGLFIDKRKLVGQSYFWVLDRMVIVVALAGAMIRLGNLMNSEIYGVQTSLPWGFIFVQDDPFKLPRHPTQIYESLFCVILFISLFFYWKKRRLVMAEGTIFGIFMIALFSFRFLVEFLKESQVAFEDDMPLNMGQLLSIPLVAAGAAILINKRTKKKKEPVHQGTGS